MALPVVIFKSKAQAKEVERLQEFAMRYDATKIQIVPEGNYVETDYDLYPDVAFRAVADRMAGHSFIYVESDSIPLKIGWAQDLTKEFLLKARPFLLTSDSHMPYDRISGIGVYGPETHWLIPKKIPHSKDTWYHAWDGWLLEHVPHLIARTELIQHSYGIYDDEGLSIPHRFPRDKDMLRPEAVIFHKDKYQDLLK